MSDHVKKAFEELFQGFLDSEQSLPDAQLQYVESLINDVFITYEQHTRLYDDTMEVDYQLVGDGIIVTDDYLSLIMDGTFHSVKGDDIIDEEHENEEKHQYMSSLPYNVAERGPAQVMISDYTMNSLINTSLDLQWYDFTQQLKGDAVNNYISQFSKAFGDKTIVDIVAKPVKDTQNLRISGTKGITKLTGLVDMLIQNPFASRKMDAVKLTVEMIISIRI